MKIARIEEKAGYVEVALEGEFSAHHLVDLMASVRRAAELKAGSRIFINAMALVGSLTLIDRYKLGMSTVGIPTTLKLAFAAAPAIVGSRHLGEEIARSRGVWVKAFDSEAAAVGWLLGTAEIDPPPSMTKS